MKFNRDFLMSVVIGMLLALILIGSLIFIKLIPFGFDFVYGEKVIDQTLAQIVGNATNPDEIALSIMAWELEYFDNPYSNYDGNSTLQKFRIYSIDGNYKWFMRPAPASWIIHSRLANCGEYAIVFATLMDKTGIETNVIRTEGGDHMWAEYMHDGYRIAVDPSVNYVIGMHKKDFENRMGVKFSYVESSDLQGKVIDVSDEYIDRENVTISVFKNGKPVDNAQIIIKSPYLMENKGGKYNKPAHISSKRSDEDGEITLRLGNTNYISEVKVKRMYIVEYTYNKNFTVNGSQESVIFNLENETSKIKISLAKS